MVIPLYTTIVHHHRTPPSHTTSTLIPAPRLHTYFPHPNAPHLDTTLDPRIPTQKADAAAAKGATRRTPTAPAVDVKQHTVPVLSGCRISITGFAKQKAELQVLVEGHGGKHAADLTKDCTHLISDGAPSAKLR